MRHTLTLVLLLCTAALAPALGQNVRVTIQAPAQTEEGQRVTVSYRVNTEDVDDIQVGDFPGFDLLYGPSTSQQSSMTMVNGRTTQSSSVTFTYTLLAVKAGTYKLPPATVKAGGRNYRSPGATIQVLPASQGGGTPARMRTQQAGDRITGKDLYISVTASKRRVYEQEAVMLTYKLYTLVSIDRCEGKMPELDGFHVQEIPLPQQKTLKMERIEGRNYGTVVWSQYLLYPQKTGRLKVPPLRFEVDVVQQDRSADPFDAFFGGGNSLLRVQKTVTAPAVELEVQALPEKPAHFSGAVGTDFRLSASLSPEQVDANDAVQLRLVVSGTGNLKLMNAPLVAWPKDFETYAPKVTDKTKTGAAGAEGNVLYEYTAVPRHGGAYTIAPVSFCYFDTEKRAYRTLRTDSLHLKVAKGVGRASRSAAGQEELKVLNSDIRHIKTRGQDLLVAEQAFFGTSRYWGLYVGVGVLFGATAWLLRRQVKSRADGDLRRGRKAGKEAQKRLRAAKSLMKEGQSAAFYDELMRALWGYVSDKLNLPMSQLDKDNVAQAVTQRGVSAEEAAQFLRVLGDCEFARFAPGDPASQMDRLYADASAIINQLDTKL